MELNKLLSFISRTIDADSIDATELRLSEEDAEIFAELFYTRTGLKIDEVAEPKIQGVKVYKLDKQAFENIYDVKGNQISYLINLRTRNIYLLSLTNFIKENKNASE